jgi:hypothetical protein
MAYNFQTGTNKMKQLTEYESVTQKVLFGNAVLAAFMFIFHKQFYFVVSGLKIICHGNPDNNLESLCIITVLLLLLVMEGELFCCEEYQYVTLRFGDGRM